MVGRMTALAACLALAGCATPYQEMGALGGVEAHRIADDTLQVLARGNAYTDPATIQRYALRKAAEATIQAGYDYFAIVGDQDASRRGQVYSGGATGGWRTAWLFGTSWEMIKPGATVIVKMMRAPAPDPLPANVYDARKSLAYLSGGDYMPPPPRPRPR